METKEYRTFDKSEWGDGPWQNEPDKLQWQDETTGLPCLVVRNTRVTGALCGYVGVAEGHPDFEKGYDDVDVEVHGGLTFADFCHPHDTEAEGICHLPGPGEPDHVWWLGFDCSHSGDVSPAIDARMRKLPFGETLYGATWQPTYKALGYVKAEVTRLAAQIKERAGSTVSEPLQAERRAATSRGARSTEDAGRPGPSDQTTPEQPK